MPDPESWRRLYPFTSRWLEVAGGRCHYVDEGQGETLLLVHGNPTWSFHWRELIAAWRGRRRVVAIDHLGCGLSDKPPGFPYCLRAHIENLRRLVEELDLRQITLVAQDWGGAIGLGVAGEMPERFARFVLFNTAAFRSRRMPWRIRICRTPLLGRLAVQGANAFVRAALRMALVHRERLTPDVRAGYLAPYDSWRNRGAVQRFVEDIPLRESHPSYGTLLEVESRLSLFQKHPALLVWGMRDWCFTPHFLERFLDFWPQAEAHRLADAGHWVIEDAPERVLELTEDFFGRHPLPVEKDPR